VLLVVADAGSGAAAAERVDEIGAVLGAPDLRVVASWAAVALWGREHAQSDPFVIDGRASLPPASATASLLDRAALVRGDFALAGVDDDGVVLASGGAGGYRPIYVAQPAPGRLIASTSMTLVRRLTSRASPIDADAMAAQAAAAMLFSSPRTEADATLFSGIKRVPMYEAWRVGRDGRVRRTQTFVPLAGAEPAARGRDLVEPVREALRVAVRRSIEGHARAGVMVSGGVDSSALLAVACDLQRRGDVTTNVEAFAWDYETHYGDDRPYLRSLARHLGVEPHLTRPPDAAAVVSSSFVADGMPYHGPGAPLLAALSRGTRERGTTVVLTGIGGDDVLDGEPDLFADLVRHGRALRALVYAARLRGPMMGGVAWRAEQYLVRPIVRDLVPGMVRRLRRKRAFLARYPWAGPRLLRYLDTAAGCWSRSEPRLDWSAAKRFEVMARSPYLLQVCIGRAQEEAILGCIRRDPFYDEDFMRMVASLPPLSLMHGHFRRGLLRDAMRGLVPNDVRRRETKAIMEPALGQTVAAAGGFGVLGHLADVRMLAELGIAEPGRFRRAFDELARDPGRGAWTVIWPALAAEDFLRREAGAVLQ
jgi:asparagine synthase (glutamine-hydrolysing)